ncbi:MAG: hypothetical protein HFI67_12065 [Lachnospiraceae bacterium]|nr:hypothetical protein [Lachnospiraceae bacterium]
MYSVTYGGKLIYRSGSNELQAYGLHLAERESRPSEFSFQVPAGNPRGGDLEARKAEVVTYDSRDGLLAEEYEIFRGKITRIETDFQDGKQVECTGVLDYLKNSVQRQSEHHNETVAQFLSYLLDRHNEQVSEEERIFLGAVTVRDSNDSVYRYTNYETTLECIEKKLLDKLGGHLELRRSGGKNYLDYLAEYRNTGSQPVEFGRNLLDFSKNMDGSEIYTMCLPLGARLEESPIEALDAYLTIESVNGGKDYVENPESIAVYGRRVKVVSWDDVTIPENLKRKAEEWLVSSQYANLSLEVTAIDLSMAGEEFESFRVGDETLVYSRPHGLNRRFPITARDRYFDHPEKNTITLGKTIVGGIVGSLQSGQEEARDRLSKILSNNQLLAMAKNNATQLITAAMNGYVVTSPDEILIMDTPKKETAKRVWRWNLAGLGYSKNGYEGPYETAMTMDGAIVADFITAGVLRGIIIKSFREEFYGEYGTEIQSGKIIEWANGTKLAELTMKGDFSKRPELRDIALAIVNSAKAGGFSIEFRDDNAEDRKNYMAVKFECEDGEKSKQKSTFYRRQDFYGKQYFYGEPEFNGEAKFKNKTAFEHYVDLKYGLRLYNAAGTFRGRLALTGDNGDVILAGLSGKNKAALGYAESETGGVGGIVEASTAWEDYKARVQGGLRITGDLAASGTKNRIVDVGDRKILMNAYETADCLFGDSGSGLFDFKGELVVKLDETFRKTIEGDYNVFAYGYAGIVTVKEKHETEFILSGQPGTRVDYEIRAKQKGYGDVRMKEFKEEEDGEY